MGAILGIVGLVVALAALGVAVGQWLRPRPAIGPTKRLEFEGEITGTPSAQNETFISFLSKNEGRKAFLDVQFEGTDLAQPEGQWLASTQFTVPLDSHLGHTTVILIDVEDPKDSNLWYAHGFWRLKGYFAIVGFAYVGQGYEFWKIHPIPWPDAVE